ncbi:hypothetical protein L4D00_10640 [Photobacterium swingsii]|uniref:DUF7661 family protein n=1 Tax=Photobacterium swingsii TaxID=680026 RepID=UPI00352EAC09
MLIRFNVYGTIMAVQRKNEEWLLFKESETSMRVRIYDVVIPAELPAEVLAQYLADIFHEHACERYSEVEQYKG